jgi:enoyl-CoA hydratase/carnithine racemase
MARLEEYANKFKSIQLERRDGIVQMRLHTDGETLRWGKEPHDESGHCYYDIGSDPENRAVIVTGTGDSFVAHYARGPILSGIFPGLQSGLMLLLFGVREPCSRF